MFLSIRAMNNFKNIHLDGTSKKGSQMHLPSHSSHWELNRVRKVTLH